MGKYNSNRNVFDSNSNHSNKNNSDIRSKKSGATFFPIKEGKSAGMIGFNAWRSGKNGMLKFSAFGYDCVKGATCEFQKAVCEVTNTSTGQTSKYPCLINVTTKRCVIQEMGIIITAAGFGVTSGGIKVRGAVVRISK